MQASSRDDWIERAVIQRSLPAGAIPLSLYVSSAVEQLTRGPQESADHQQLRQGHGTVHVPIHRHYGAVIEELHT